MKITNNLGKVKEFLYPEYPVFVDLPRETENLIMSDEFSHLSISKIEEICYPAAYII